jgi:hypothetical protein
LGNGGGSLHDLDKGVVFFNGPSFDDDFIKFTSLDRIFVCDPSPDTVLERIPSCNEVLSFAPSEEREADDTDLDFIRTVVSASVDTGGFAFTFFNDFVLIKPKPSFP